MKIIRTAGIAFLSIAAVSQASLRIEPARPVTLQGAGATQQFLAIATMTDGLERDVTGEVDWLVSDATRAVLSKEGRLQAIADRNIRRFGLLAEVAA